MYGEFLVICLVLKGRDCMKLNFSGDFRFFYDFSDCFRDISKHSIMKIIHLTIVNIATEATIKNILMLLFLGKNKC